jgi:hypothetical protein
VAAGAAAVDELGDLGGLPRQAAGHPPAVRELRGRRDQYRPVPPGSGGRSQTPGVCAVVDAVSLRG